MRFLFLFVQYHNKPYLSTMKINCDLSLIFAPVSIFLSRYLTELWDINSFSATAAVFLPSINAKTILLSTESQQRTSCSACKKSAYSESFCFGNDFWVNTSGCCSIFIPSVDSRTIIGQRTRLSTKKPVRFCERYLDSLTASSPRAK